jgi:hypothetical protein
MRKERKARKSAVTGSANVKEAIVDSSSTATEKQSNVSSNTAPVATPVAPSQGIQHPTGTESEGDHPHNWRNGQGKADTGQPSIEPPNNREKIPQNRERREAVGFGRPPVASRFRPGKSGNPGGRPRKLVVSERYAEMLEMRLPPVQRRQLEQEIGMKLPKKFTFGDAIALKTGVQAMSNVKAVREIRESVEGQAPQRTLVLEPVQRDGDELRKRIFGKLVETAYKRGKLYNMEMPALDQMAKDAGVSLAEAMGDVKPDSPEEGIGDKES